MQFNTFFNQIKLSSVNENEDKTNRNNDDSIIHELKMLDSQENFASPVQRIESFVYAEEIQNGRSSVQMSQNDSFQDDKSNLGFGTSKTKKYYAQNNHHRYQYQQKQKYQGLSEWPVTVESPSNKKSIRQQIMEENRKLEQKLKMKQKYKVGLFSALNKQKYVQNEEDQSPKQQKRQQKIMFQKEISNSLEQKLQEQYNNSNVIRLYNFLVKELPVCQKCQHTKNQVIKGESGIKITCQECPNNIEKASFNSLIGILYDLENKGRFQEELNCFQFSLDSISLEIQKLKEQIYSLESLKEKLTNLKMISRKKFKQINESKFYLKRHINNLTKSHYEELQQSIPKEYLDQMEIWKEIESQSTKKWRNIFQNLEKIMPIYLHDHVHSKILSALHKILNYQNEHEVKISVSESIKFPIKNMQKMVLVIDGTYSLPVFDHVKHLHLQFQNKKTKRQLNLLFGNFPRVIESLSFHYNHKNHSHISAETFPFLKYLAPLASIQQLDLTISNVKEFNDILKLPQQITPKRELKLKIKRHLFAQQHLILPDNYFDILLERLGPDLVVLELQLPESVDSQAIFNFSNYISMNKLCKLKISRGDRDNPQRKNLKILDQCGEKNRTLEKKQEAVFKKLMGQRISLIRMIRRFGVQTSSKKQFISSVQSLL